MADEKKPDPPAPPEKSTEKKQGPAPAPSIDIAALVAALANASPADKAKIRAAVGTAPPPTTPGPRKYSVALAEVAAGDVGGVIEAIDEGLELAAQGGDAADPLAPLRAVSPELAAAASANSGYRRKDLAHSLRVAKTWLEQHHPPKR
jgi:hypothetical protein